MRVLAIDCVTKACSVALFEDGRLLAHHHELIGRGHAEHLVPLIARLPASGRAGTILVSLGPGSFTGVRIGLAAARALGLAWASRVLGYPTLALVAAMARIAHPGSPVTVAMKGGHGEYFVQDFDGDGMPSGPPASLAPEAVAVRPLAAVIAGDGAQQVAQLATGRGHAAPATVMGDVVPDARHALLVAHALHIADPRPIYGRPPDASLPQTGPSPGSSGVFSGAPGQP